MKPKHILVLEGVTPEEAESFKEVAGVEHVHYTLETTLCSITLDKVVNADFEKFKVACEAIHARAPEAILLASGELFEAIAPLMPASNPRWN